MLEKVSRIHKTYLLDQQLFCWRQFFKTEVVQNTDLNILALYCTNKNILFSGLIAVPINCMMSVTGNCSYKYDKNYVLPNYTCRLEKDNTTFVVQEKYASYHRSDFIYFHSRATLTKSL